MAGLNPDYPVEDERDLIKYIQKRHSDANECERDRLMRMIRNRFESLFFETVKGDYILKRDIQLGLHLLELVVWEWIPSFDLERRTRLATYLDTCLKLRARILFIDEVCFGRSGKVSTANCRQLLDSEYEHGLPTDASLRQLNAFNFALATSLDETEYEHRHPTTNDVDPCMVVIRNHDTLIVDAWEHLEQVSSKMQRQYGEEGEKRRLHLWSVVMHFMTGDNVENRTIEELAEAVGVKRQRLYQVAKKLKEHLSTWISNQHPELVPE